MIKFFETKIVESDVAPKNVRYLWFDVSTATPLSTESPRLKVFSNGSWRYVAISTPSATSTPTPEPTSSPSPEIPSEPGTYFGQ